jgi:hypothetical protein
MPKAALVLWLAGNQFFAMDDVVHAFQAQHPGTTVGLITLPPACFCRRSRRAAGFTPIRNIVGCLTSMHL